MFERSCSSDPIFPIFLLRFSSFFCRKTVMSRSECLSANSRVNAPMKMIPETPSWELIFCLSVSAICLSCFILLVPCSFLILSTCDQVFLKRLSLRHIS